MEIRNFHCQDLILLALQETLQQYRKYAIARGLLYIVKRNITSLYTLLLDHILLYFIHMQTRGAFLIMCLHILNVIFPSCIYMCIRDSFPSRINMHMTEMNCSVLETYDAYFSFFSWWLNERLV